jgi:hypothetical protein
VLSSLAWVCDACGLKTSARMCFIFFALHYNNVLLVTSPLVQKTKYSTRSQRVSRLHEIKEATRILNTEGLLVYSYIIKRFKRGFSLGIGGGTLQTVKDRRRRSEGVNES